LYAKYRPSKTCMLFHLGFYHPVLTDNFSEIKTVNRCSFNNVNMVINVLKWKMECMSSGSRDCARSLSSRDQLDRGNRLETEAFINQSKARQGCCKASRLRPHPCLGDMIGSGSGSDEASRTRMRCAYANELSTSICDSSNRITRRFPEGERKSE
jgi:hypothetical protein